MSSEFVSFSVQEIAAGAQDFARQLAKVKAENRPDDWTWYGYDTMANIQTLEHLLTETKPDLFTQIRSPILDIGAADGDFAFYL